MTRPMVLRPIGLGPLRPRRALVTAAAGVLILLVAAGCGGSTASDSGCGPVRREPLDPRSVHALPGAPEPEYRTDPPTSGPHLPSPAGAAVRSEPLAPSLQVGLLEEGAVVIQHHGLSEAEETQLEALGGAGVVVAPAAEPLPDGAAVVATAWVTKQVCGSLDLAALRQFAADHRDQGPGGHG